MSQVTSTEFFMEEKDDNTVISLALKGNQDAFTELYNRHNIYVRNVLHKITRETDVDDMHQDTFTLAFTRLHQFRKRSTFRTWLCSIAVNVHRMYTRIKYQQTSHNTLHFEDLEPIKVYPVLARRDINLEGVVDRLAIQEALTHIPDNNKICFVMHYINGYEYNEISRQLNRSVGTCKAQSSRARVKLREQLE